MNELLEHVRHLDLFDLVDIDLRRRPFTDRGSRLLVVEQDDGALSVTRAARPGPPAPPEEPGSPGPTGFTRPSAGAVVLSDLRLYGPSGAELRVRFGRPDRIAFEDGVNLAFGGPESLVVTGPPGVRAAWTGPEGNRHETLVAGYLPLVGDRPGAARRPAGLAVLREARIRWTAWFDRMPPVRADLRIAAAEAWWTLAVNLLPAGTDGAGDPSGTGDKVLSGAPGPSGTVREGPSGAGSAGSAGSAGGAGSAVHGGPSGVSGAAGVSGTGRPVGVGAGGLEALVPAKPGRLRVRDRDACFHAVALRHADPRLARDQLRLVLDRRLPDGRAAETEKRFRSGGGGDRPGTVPVPVPGPGPGAGSAVGNGGNGNGGNGNGEGPGIGAGANGAVGEGPGAPVADPPLLAWAAWKIHEIDPDPVFLAAVHPALVRAHAWWAAVSRADGEGYDEGVGGTGERDRRDRGPGPGGGRPPVPRPPRDHGPRPGGRGPRTGAVDMVALDAFLVHDADRLADITGTIGLPDEAAVWRSRAVARTDRLVRRSPAAVRTPYGALPLFSGRLPRGLASLLVEELARGGPAPEPGRSGAVALDTGYLLIDALRRSGFPEEAAMLTERCLRDVVAAGGPDRYGNPAADDDRSGTGGATTGSGWSAALFLDLARH